MKKTILFIAALFLCIGTQSVMGQSKTKQDVQNVTKENIAEQAKLKTTKLTRVLKLDEQQQQMVYRLFAQSGEKMSKVNPEHAEAAKTKLNAYVDQKMKGILNEEQYNTYLELASKQ